METATRNAHGRLLRGCSGDPAGKRPGTLNRATHLKRWLTEVDEELAARALIAQAGKGNVAALRIVFDRIDPKPRGRIIALDLPDDAMLQEKFDAAFAALAAGEITPEEALMVVRFLEHQSKVIGDAADGATMREVYAIDRAEKRREPDAARAEAAALEAPESSAVDGRGPAFPQHLQGTPCDAPARAGGFRAAARATRACRRKSTRE
jgi:hypothetical protein